MRREGKEYEGRDYGYGGWEGRGKRRRETRTCTYPVRFNIAENHTVNICHIRVSVRSSAVVGVILLLCLHSYRVACVDLSVHGMYID